MTEIQKTDPVKNAAVAAGVTLAFYALPDFVRSKTLRTLGKSALLAASSAQAVGMQGELWENNAQELRNFLDGSEADALKAVAGVTAAVSSVGIAAVVVAEKAIFNRAEKKRASGKKFAHTKQAFVIAALTGGLLYALESAEIS